MKGLDHIPSRAELLSAYNELESGPLEPDQLARMVCFARFDPRLAEMLVQGLARDWKGLDAFAVNTAILGTPWPAALGVVVEHTTTLLPPASLNGFTRWSQAALFKVHPASGEQFWIAVHHFAGKLAHAEVSGSLKLYSRWGYYGSDWLRSKAAAHKHTRTVLSRPRRLQILHELAENRAFFNLRDYLEAAGGGVQRRTAELDLAGATFLKSRGKTRGRMYSLRTSRAGKK